MISIERKIRSDLIRILWAAVNSQEAAAATVPKLVKFVTSNSGLSADEAKRLVNDAVDDGFLVSGANSGTGRNPKAFRIPIDDKSTIQDLDYDLYCFECHEPRNLQKCLTCPRAFHIQCIPQNPSNTSTARPPPSARGQRPDLNQQQQQQQLNDTAASNSGMADVTAQSSSTSFQQSIQASEIEIMEDELIEMKPAIDQSSLKTEDFSSFGEATEFDSKDVICVGEVRPPSRRNRRVLSSSYKDAIEMLDDLEGDRHMTELCSLCRLQINDGMSPPMQLEETNYLLKFILGRIKSWISADTFSPLQFSTTIPLSSAAEFELFERKCFKFSKTFEFVSRKLSANEYGSCMEFQSDILDIRHCLGILYGVQSAEYEACSYLLSDCLFELSEMRKCPDCYRHSNEKSNDLWFCKPCVPRHELVFAKQIGYSHWPAKVIKVENNRYDVRFFGTNHSRAVIDAAHVMPIDTDMKLLKIKKTPGFNRSMEELQLHQEMLQWSPGCFSYEAERTNPVDLSGIRSKSFNKKSATKTGSGKGKRLNSNSMIADETSLLDMSGVSMNMSQTEIESSRESATPAGKKRLSNSKAIAGRKNAKGESARKRKSKPNANSTPSKKTKANPKGKDNAKEKTTTANEIQASSSNRSSSANETSQKRSEANLNNGQDSEVSSTQDNSDQQKPTSTSSARIKANLGKLRQDAETLRRGLIALNCTSEACKLATEALQSEIDRNRQLLENQNRLISETKKRQWCYHCEKEAIYHCCWNTAYCSTECQQKHWQMEHKKTCRRKR